MKGSSAFCDQEGARLCPFTLSGKFVWVRKTFASANLLRLTFLARNASSRRPMPIITRRGSRYLDFISSQGRSATITPCWTETASWARTAPASAIAVRITCPISLIARSSTLVPLGSTITRRHTFSVSGNVSDA